MGGTGGARALPVFGLSGGRGGLLLGQRELSGPGRPIGEGVGNGLLVPPLIPRLEEGGGGGGGPLDAKKKKKRTLRVNQQTCCNSVSKKHILYTILILQKTPQMVTIYIL